MIGAARAPLMVLTAGLIGAGLAQWLLLTSVLDAHEARCAGAMAQAVSRVIERAHRLQDDLTMQSVFQGFSRASGVQFACLVDTTNTIRAHSRPSLLGKSFEPGRARGTGLWRFPLKEARATWATLILKFSRRPSGSALRRQLLLLAGTGVVAGLSIGWLLRRFKILEDKQKVVQATAALRLQSINEELSRVRSRADASDAAWAACVRYLLDQTPQPVLLLDHTQRVIAWNQQASRSAGVEAETISGRSWHELPILAAFGPTIQESLDRPGEWRSFSGEPGPVEFLTTATPSQMVTWVRFSNPPRP